MSIDIPTITDLDVVETEETETESFPWAKEISKELTLSAATTAGLGAGVLLVGLAYGAYTTFRDRRSKKSEPEVPVVTDLPAPTEA